MSRAHSNDLKRKSRPYPPWIGIKYASFANWVFGLHSSYYVRNFVRFVCEPVIGLCSSLYVAGYGHSVRMTIGSICTIFTNTPSTLRTRTITTYLYRSTAPVGLDRCWFPRGITKRGGGNCSLLPLSHTRVHIYVIVHLCCYNLDIYYRLLVYMHL